MDAGRKRRCWQFGMSTLLLVTLVCGVAAWSFDALVLEQFEQEQRTVAEIRQRGGHVTTEAIGPEWLDWVDPRYRHRAVAVHLVGPNVDDTLLVHVRSLEHLRKLWLVETATTAEGTRQLQQQRPRLEIRVVQGFPLQSRQEVNR